MFAMIITTLGCDQFTFDDKSFAFWTSIESDNSHELLINGESFGTIPTTATTPDCGHSLLNYVTLHDNDTLKIAISHDNTITDIADLIFFKSYSGMSVKRYGNANIAIEEGIDDECNLIFVSW